MQKLNQYPEESYEDWFYRLALAKSKKEIQASWQEVADILHLPYGAEHFRKVAYGLLDYRKYLDAKDKAEMDDSLRSELEEKELELRREKMRLQDQKREVNKLLREWARAEHIQDEIQKAICNMEALPVLERHVEYSENSMNEAILMLSDWHIGMMTDNAVNTFNHAVLMERIEKLLENTIIHCRRHDIRRIHLFVLGDIVNGLIHVTTRINNEENVIKQSMMAAEILANMMNRLSETMDVDIWWSRGNHDRVTANKKESICGESFADLILWYLRARMEGIEGITFHENTVDDEIVVADICGNMIFAAHGHKDKPAKAVENLSLLLKQFPDMVLLGHFHSAAEREIQGAEVIVNGSLCGTDDYAMSLRRTSHPSQKLLIVNPEGRECTYTIRLL